MEMRLEVRRLRISEEHQVQDLHDEKDEQDREDLRALAYLVAPQIICLYQGFVSRGVLVVYAHLLLRGAFVLRAAYDINPLIILIPPELLFATVALYL